MLWVLPDTPPAPLTATVLPSSFPATQQRFNTLPRCLPRDPIAAETMFRALEQLYALGALNDKGELTTMGGRQRR